MPSKSPLEGSISTEPIVLSERDAMRFLEIMDAEPNEDLIETMRGRLAKRNQRVDLDHSK